MAVGMITLRVRVTRALLCLFCGWAILSAVEGSATSVSEARNHIHDVMDPGQQYPLPKAPPTTLLTLREDLLDTAYKASSLITYQTLAGALGRDRPRLYRTSSGTGDAYTQLWLSSLQNSSYASTPVQIDSYSIETEAYSTLRCMVQFAN